MIWLLAICPSQLLEGSCVRSHGGVAQIFLLDTEEQSRSEADGQAWKEDAQWARILDQEWDLQAVKQVMPPLPSAYCTDSLSRRPLATQAAQCVLRRSMRSSSGSSGL